MSTIDDAQLEWSGLCDDGRRKVKTLSAEKWACKFGTELIVICRAQEQEIARLQDQLATARNALKSIGCRMMGDTDCSERPEEFQCYVCAALAAIPTSDRERLLEEAREELEEACSCIQVALACNSMPKDENGLPRKALKEAHGIIHEVRAKLGASNQ
jgi:hypothetical protein